MIGQGDYFQAQVNYTQGALRYIFSATQGSWLYREGDSAGVGTVSRRRLWRHDRLSDHN